MPRPPSRDLMWPLILSVAVLLIIGVAITTQLGDSGQENPQPASGEPGGGGVSSDMRELGDSLANRESGDPMALGEAEAPVVMVVYSDYQCPYCKKWVQEHQSELVDQYVEDGDLRIEWREFPYMGEDSETLAVGGRAAAEQDAFWEYHQAVYDAQDRVKDAGSELEERMADIAADAGLDQSQFTTDLQRDDLAEAVQEDFTEGQEIGVSGTPAFLINGDPIMGAQPLSEFTASIDSALAEAEG